MSDPIAPPASAGFNSPPVASSASPVTIPAAELARYRALESEYQEFQAKTLPELRSAHEAALKERDTELSKASARAAELEQGWGAERGAWANQETARQAELAASQAHANRLRDAYHSKAKSEALALAISGVEFSGSDPSERAEAAAQFLALIGPSFETAEVEGNPIVREKTSGRAAGDVLRELLADRRFQHFLAPRSRGGAGTDATGSMSSLERQFDGTMVRPGSLEWNVAQFQRGQHIAERSTGIRLK